MTREHLDHSVSRRDVLQGAAAIGLKPLLKRFPATTATNLEAGATAVSTPTVAEQAVALSSAEVQFSKLGGIVDLITNICRETKYEPQADTLGGWEEKAAEDRRRLGTGLVGVSHSLYQSDGETFDVARVSFYPTDDLSKYVEILFRKTGIGVGRINNGLELKDEDFGIDRNASYDDVNHAAISRSIAYEEAVDKSQFRAFDIDVCTQAIQEAFGPDASTSTYMEDAVLPMLDLDGLKAFNDFWQTNYSSTEFRIDHSIDNRGHLVIDRVVYEAEGGGVDLLEELRRFPDVVRIVTTVSNIRTMLLEARTSSDVVELSSEEIEELLLDEGEQNQGVLEESYIDEMPILEIGDTTKG